MTEPEEAPSLDMVTAALRADSADVALYSRVLSESLSEALPPGAVEVERDRTLADRMMGRPGEITRIVVRLGDQVMTLGFRRGKPEAEIWREVRGVVLSRRTVSLEDWTGALAAALVKHAEQSAAAARVLRRLVAGG